MKARKILKGHNWYPSGGGCSCGPSHDPATPRRSKGRLVKVAPIKVGPAPAPVKPALHWTKLMRRERCHYCGGPGGTIDHVIPQSEGGRTVRGNCVPACAPCNNFRKSKPYAKFKKVGWLERPFAQ